MYILNILPYNIINSIKKVNIMRKILFLLIFSFSLLFSLDKSSINPIMGLSNESIKEDFLVWAGDLNRDRVALDKLVNPNSGYRWRSNSSRLMFRIREHILRELGTTSPKYLITIFNSNGENGATESIDISSVDSGAKIDGIFDKSIKFRLILFDGKEWYISQKKFKNGYLSIKGSRFRHISNSLALTDAISNNSSLPEIKTDRKRGIDLKNIQGFGILYDKGAFTISSLGIYKHLAPNSIDIRHIVQHEISSKLFGLCVTPSWTTMNEKFITQATTWSSFFRWPGGYMIEHYNLKNPSKNIEYSFVGKWIDRVREYAPDIDFLIGVSSVMGAKDGKDVETYGYEFANYLNRDFDKKWGANPERYSSANLHYVEVGNEPDLEKISAHDYGETLKRYANGIHRADSSVKISGPTTMHGNINTMLKDVVKDYGDYLDIIDSHNYTDTPKQYALDIEILRDHIRRYINDNDRRSKDEMQISFSEYNSLNVATRGGVYHEMTTAKGVWVAQVMKHFIYGGLDMASFWHGWFNGGHAMYGKGYEPYFTHFVMNFFKKYIDFNDAKVVFANSAKDNLLILPIVSNNRLNIFLINSSPTKRVKTSINIFPLNINRKSIIETLYTDAKDEYYAPVAIKYEPSKAGFKNVEPDRVKAVSPDVKIYEEDKGDHKVTYAKFPKLDIKTSKRDVKIINGKMKVKLLPYSISVVSIDL